MTKEQEPRLRELSTLDFVEGVFLATTKRTASPIRFKRYDSRIHFAFAETYTALKELAEPEGISLPFTIRLHPTHGDSGTLASAFEELLGYGDLRPEDATFTWLRYEIDPGIIDSTIERLPGSSELYNELATTFIHSLYEPITNRAAI